MPDVETDLTPLHRQLHHSTSTSGSRRWIACDQLELLVKIPICTTTILKKTTIIIAQHSRAMATWIRGTVIDSWRSKLPWIMCWYWICEELPRSPPRASADDRMYSSAHPERGPRDGRYPDSLEHDYEFDRPRSPRREGRARYTDRDREDYKSPPRHRSRSRSPYFGAPPNRNVILEGLPLEMAQEDVGRPVPTPLRTSYSTPNTILS